MCIIIQTIHTHRSIRKYMEKYSILSSKNTVNFICDDIHWYPVNHSGGVFHLHYSVNVLGWMIEIGRAHV